MMPAAHADQIISGYLSRLEVAVRTLPGGRGAELLDVFREHIAEARARTVDENDADLLNILDRLGDPIDIVAEERARLDAGNPVPADTRSLLDIMTVVALLIIWPVGVVLLWMSDAWSTRDKLIGTLLPPGGSLGVLVFAALLGGSLPFGGCVGSVSTSGSPGGPTSAPVYATTCPNAAITAAVDAGQVLIIVLAVVLLVMPLLTALYLGMRLRRSGSRRVGNAVVGGVVH
jgi:uncharacterized membrane protein